MTRQGFRLLLAVVALASLATLGTRPLYRADESRYAEIPREMAASGDWITPRLNGYKYFEKPPLQYWATAAFFKLAGESDVAARLWTALACFAGLVLVAAAGNRLFAPPAGYYAAAVLIGSPLYVLLGQVNTLDMGLTFFLSAAVFAFALGHMLLFWAACAAAVLSKGLVGIALPLVTIALYIAIRRDFALLRRMKLLSGGALFLALSVPWFIAVSARNPEFAQFFFIHEHFERFTSTVHQRAQPAWYFAPILLAGVAPWALPVFAGWWSAARSRSMEFDSRLFLALWAAVVFVFFSASGSKLASYVLPMLPALAVLAGGWLSGASAARALFAQGLLGCAAGAAIAAFAWRMPQYAAWLAATGACIGVASLGAAVLARLNAVPAAVAMLAIGGFAATHLAIAGHGARLGPRFSVAATVAALPAPIPAGASVFAMDAYDHTIPWVLRRTVTMVRGKDELETPIAWEPQKFLADIPQFRRAWEAAPEAYAFLDAAQFDARGGQYGVPMQLLARGPRYVIVKKP